MTPPGAVKGDGAGVTPPYATPLPAKDPPKGGEPCMHCGSPLYPRARFCTECELFQRSFWKSKSALGYWTLINAALATSVLAGTLIFQGMPEWDKVANSQVSVTTQTCYLDRALVGVANRGRRFATFRGGKVIAHGLELVDGKPPERPLLVWPAESVLKEKSVGVLDLVFLGPGMSGNLFLSAPDPNEAKDCWYEIELRYDDFRPTGDGTSTERPGPARFRSAPEATSTERIATTRCDCPKFSYDAAHQGVRRKANAPAEPAGAPG